MSSGRPEGDLRPSRRDELDWPALYERHGPELAAYVLRLVGEVEAAQDIVQDTFVRAIRKQATLRDPRAVRSWLYRIATRLVIERRRRRALLAFVPFVGSERAPEPDRETAALVRTALSRIPTDQAVALVLAYHEGLARSEIASLLDVREETINTRISRGRKNFGAAYRRLERGLAG